VNILSSKQIFFIFLFVFFNLIIDSASSFTCTRRKEEIFSWIFTCFSELNILFLLFRFTWNGLSNNISIRQSHYCSRIDFEYLLKLILLLLWLLESFWVLGIIWFELRFTHFKNLSNNCSTVSLIELHWIRFFNICYFPTFFFLQLQLTWFSVILLWRKFKNKLKKWVHQKKSLFS